MLPILPFSPYLNCGSHAGFFKHSIVAATQLFRPATSAATRLHRCIGRHPQYRGLGDAALPVRALVAGQRLFFWAYTIEITNRGAETVHSRPAIGGSPTRTAAAGGARRRRGWRDAVLDPENHSNTPAACHCRPRRFHDGTYGMVTAAGEGSTSKSRRFGSSFHGQADPQLTDEAGSPGSR